MSTEEEQPQATTTTTTRKGIRSLFRRKKRADKDDGETQPAAETTVIEDEPQDDMSDPEQVQETTTKMEQAQEEPVVEAPKRKGCFGFFKRGNKGSKAKQDDVAAPEDEPVVEDELNPGADDDGQEEGVENDEKEEEVDANPAGSPTLVSAPSARDSAFSGEVRYDWIDVETAAAIKIQSNYRRSRVMANMEKEGKTTAAIRNRTRRIEARKKKAAISASSDIPNIFTCCGVGLAFGEATETDQDAVRDLESEQYQEQKRQQEEHEEKLRSDFKKKISKSQDDTEEMYEMVE